MAELLADLTLEPKDAVAFFRAKGEQLAWDYTEVWREQNVHAFTVAKATTADVLRTIRAQVDKAISTGQTFEDFKRTLRPRLQELGWWGQQEVLDGETGEITQAQLGSTRRLRTIYQTNVQTAYMAGRYKRYLENVDARPYWRYVAIMDSRTRPTHAALNGKVWRWDDPIWQVIWPPNGWGCRCRVMALSEAEFRALGVPLEDGRDAIDTSEVTVNKVGDKVTVQGVRYTDELDRQKVFRPDPGWDYNPGAAWARFDPAGFKGESIGATPVTPTPRAGVIKSQDNLPNWKELGRPDLRLPGIPRLPQPDLLPAAGSTEEAVRMLTQALLGAEKLMRVIDTPIEQVAIRAEFLPHMVEKEENARERFANYVIPALQDPFEIWLTPYSDGTARKRYIALFEGRHDLLLIVRENRDGSLFWELYNMMQGDSKSQNKARQGTLLYAKDMQ